MPDGSVALRPPGPSLTRSVGSADSIRYWRRAGRPLQGDELRPSPEGTEQPKRSPKAPVKAINDQPAARQHRQVTVDGCSLRCNADEPISRFDPNLIKSTNPLGLYGSANDAKACDSSGRGGAKMLLPNQGDGRSQGRLELRGRGDASASRTAPGVRPAAADSWTDQ